MADEPTTARAQRRQAVASGDAPTAIDALDTRDPGAGVVPGSSRSRQLDTQREIASQIGVDADGIATTATRGGMDAFLRSSGTNQFAANLREQFAGAADFVTEQDVAANVDAQAISATPEVARDRRDDVGDRARSKTASDARFIEGGDLNVDVGARGVTGLEVAADRRDDVAQRARQGLASEDPFAKPGDFEANVSASGIESAGLTDTGARRRASRQFEAETPLREADADDVTATDNGFTLDSGAQRRAAARQFEGDIGLFETGELDPATDITQTDSGFSLGKEPARELAAAKLSEQTGSTVAPSDVELSPTESGGFEAVFEREVSN